MLVMPVTRLQLDESDDTGAYYYLTFKRNPKEKYLNRFLDEDGKLSAFKMLEDLRRIIKEELKHIKSKYCMIRFHSGTLIMQLPSTYAICIFFLSQLSLHGNITGSETPSASAISSTYSKTHHKYRAAKGITSLESDNALANVTS